MFNPIPGPVLERMRTLEGRDAIDRADGTPMMRRLRQIPPETGRLLALLAASAPEGRMVEVGTSAGYSALWLALACRATGRRLTTFEVLPEKAALARDTFEIAGIGDVVDLVEGDARDHLGGIEGIGFCFLDAEKDIYADCYRLIVPNLARRGLLAADNVISHREILRPVVDEVLADRRVDAVVVPIGMGVLVCRKV